VAGYAVADIPGAMLGVLLGQVVDRRLQLHSWAYLRERMGGRTVLRNDQLLFVMLGRVAKTAGRVSEAHIDQARREMRLLAMSEQGQRRAIDAFNRGKTGNDPIRTHLQRLVRQPHTAEGLLRACWRMASAEGAAGPQQRGLIIQWGKWLGLSSAKVVSLAAEYTPHQQPVANRGGAYQDAMRLLGVDATTEPAQIKRAYRRLISRHHPDKLEGSGATESQVREATERTRELHNAYGVIRERRDFR